jgi:hypothetical protein
VSPPLTAFLLPLLAVAVLALGMVFVMVRWGRAVLEQPPRPEAVRSWWVAYLAVWTLLVAAFLWFLRRAGSTTPGRDLLLMLFVAAGWLGFSYALVAFGRALQRTNERAAVRAAEEPEAPPAADRPLGEPAAPPARAPRSHLREILEQALSLIAALAAIAVGSVLPPLQRLHDWTQTHQRPLLWITIPLGAIGFALFIGCTVAMVLAQGEPISRQEIDEMDRRILERKLGPGRMRVSAFRNFGLVVGSQAEDGASFADIKQAWALRAWAFSPRWRRMFLMMLGTALLFFGLFGSFFVIAPAGVKLLLGGAFVYAVARTAAGFARA